MSRTGALKNYDNARRLFLQTLNDRGSPSLHKYHAAVSVEEVSEKVTEIMLEQIGIKPYAHPRSHRSGA